jgi:hypothetical protein
MEPLEHDELSPSELDALLHEWQAPAAPGRLRSAIFPERAPWWRRIWSASIRVPLPVGAAIVLLAGVAVWRIPKPAAPAPAPPQVIVRTERVEVPVEHERIVTRYIRTPAPAHPITFQELRPVAELRPRIIRRDDAKN